MGTPTDKGYDVRSGMIQSEKTEVYRDSKGKRRTRNNLNASSNGRLYETGTARENGVRLWVYQWGTGFSLSGSTGQSLRMRSFFPRNRVQNTISVFCQCPDQKVYGDTIEWIRQQQRSRESSTMLEIIGKNDVPVKGNNRTLAAEGYVKTVMREHERFVYAPELRFDFLVERFLLPSNWADRLSTEERMLGPRSLPDWNTVFIENGRFRRNPDRRQAPTPPSVGKAIEEASQELPDELF